MSSTAIVQTVATAGADATAVTATARVGGPPQPDAQHAARARVFAAIHNSPEFWPGAHVALTTSLTTAPASCDLAFACAVLVAAGDAPRDELTRTAFVGELEASGALRATEPDIGPTLLAAQRAGARRIVVPMGVAVPDESDIEILRARNLNQVARWLRGRASFVQAPDLYDVFDQPEGSWAAEVAAAGGHGVTFVGTPEAGTATLARCLAGLTQARVVAPSANVTPLQLAGVATSLLHDADHGVLFLDDAAELSAPAVECIHHALRDGAITVQSGSATSTWLTRFQMALALRRRETRNALLLVQRTDIRVQLRPPSQTTPGECSADVARRVARARARGQRRWGTTNATIASAVLTRPSFALSAEALAPINRRVERGALTRHGLASVLRVAWTLGDLRELDKPSVNETSDALTLRDLRPSKERRDKHA